MACFIRHMAVICLNNAAIVNVFLPILMDKAVALRPEVMSGIFVQLKLRGQAGTPSAYAINENEIKFFSRNTTSTGGQTPRPYITLIMELGVANPPSLLAQTPTDYHSDHSKSSTALRKRRDMMEQSGNPPPIPGSPSKVVIPAPPSRGHKNVVHPRYSLYIYGCSPSVYKVIAEAERPLYKRLIRSGDLLGEHPRQHRTALDLVRNQKPFFRAFWHWVLSQKLNVDKQAGDGDGEIILGYRLKVTADDEEANDEIPF
ncbi:hypothetical protein PUNSTDRAFT_134247 [Punctularia strigosozonata HHB-11173 SS5]|uniref:uncharacterized protein n=1 Tax=Punctularia strigosozonata (strain HHB-11173) TaxID=741275 RepID=UPI0004416401|nr:uncharacterized protein PUNSTDRAFT_134247 [Punctularia strigosozonata HHB-11173 SS5]EIN09074.1 hypothetical protein PUNSTDRAFT_134247 [Punctularia strigosozonata HHB-11173 SS5]